MISLNLYWAVVYFYEEPSVVDLKSKLKCLDFGSEVTNLKKICSVCGWHLIISINLPLRNWEGYYAYSS
jgi:hypothetical protein